MPHTASCQRRDHSQHIAMSDQSLRAILHLSASAHGKGKRPIISALALLIRAVSSQLTSSSVYPQQAAGKIVSQQVPPNYPLVAYDLQHPAHISGYRTTS